LPPRIFNIQGAEKGDGASTIQRLKQVTPRRRSAQVRDGEKQNSQGKGSGYAKGDLGQHAPLA